MKTKTSALGPVLPTQFSSKFSDKKKWKSRLDYHGRSNFHFFGNEHVPNTRNSEHVHKIWEVGAKLRTIKTFKLAKIIGKLDKKNGLIRNEPLRGFHINAWHQPAKQMQYI